MKNDKADLLSVDDPLGMLLALCLEAVDRGESDLQTWVSRYPEFTSELTELFDGQARVERLAGPLRSVVQAGQMPTVTPTDAAILPGFDLPCRFGDYELLEELGRGGMGVVYRARQTNLARLVAIKMVRAGHLASSEELGRFRAETDATASLEHSNIVPIYEVGTCDGKPYYCMKLIGGGSLAEHLARYVSDPRAAAELIATTAWAVHFAHQHGILHRDLKPSNVLLDSEGRPHLVDFGLSKRLEGETCLTLSGVLIGTPSYMAPELTTGRKGAVSTATDVYGLGAILYALLTGKPPFRSETVLQTLEEVRDRIPEPPSSSNPRVDRDLETLCLKCLEKDPGQRYGSAASLAEDLERWRKGEPIQARPAKWRGRVWRWCRRNPALASMMGVIALLLIGGITALSLALVAVDHSRQDAVRHQIAEVERTNQLREREYVADIGLAYRLWRLAEPQGMVALLDRYVPREGERDLRGFEWHYLRGLAPPGRCERCKYLGHTQIVYATAISPDGKIVASGGADCNVRLWNAADGEDSVSCCIFRSRQFGAQFLWREFQGVPPTQARRPAHPKTLVRRRLATLTTTKTMAVPVQTLQVQKTLRHTTMTRLLHPQHAV